ncbi:MAG: hypothetical protein AAFZ17_02185 [Cyanobacteria bacterium J06650_10]
MPKSRILKSIFPITPADKQDTAASATYCQPTPPDGHPSQEGIYFRLGYLIAGVIGFTVYGTHSVLVGVYFLP